MNFLSSSFELRNSDNVKSLQDQQTAVYIAE